MIQSEICISYVFRGSFSISRVILKRVAETEGFSRRMMSGMGKMKGIGILKDEKTVGMIQKRRFENRG
ncbi:hypothetical protein [Exiguobacterium antarcticum]|uniref:hypothetical protein n=1 Tax=Exiguobacterium antarcticum TaxID=132920 RepID=UPI001F45B50F|nr:hypothetical protein [Exiguobacterium antarcticum]